MPLNTQNLLHGCGVIAPLWLAIGVAIAGSLYPGYNHLNQAMSELGATGSPTATLSPAINNYPLSILFSLFGLSIILRFRGYAAASWSGALVIVHGITTFTAGYFPCDVACHQEPASLSQNLHNLSGGLMLVSLTAANLIWVFIAKRSLHRPGFGVFSLLCLVLSLLALLFIPHAASTGEGFGLYQRLNYGIAAFWMMALAFVLIRTGAIDPKNNLGK